MHRVKALQYDDRAGLFALVGLPKQPEPKDEAAAGEDVSFSSMADEDTAGVSEAAGSRARLPRSPVTFGLHEACHIEGEEDDDGFEIIDLPP
jgi:hypothetical protein